MPVLRTRAHHLPTHQLHTHTSPPPPASPHENTVAQTEEGFYAAVRGVPEEMELGVGELLSLLVFSSTKVQKLTQKALLAVVNPAATLTVIDAELKHVMPLTKLFPNALRVRTCLPFALTSNPTQ